MTEMKVAAALWVAFTVGAFGFSEFVVSIDEHL